MKSIEEKIQQMEIILGDAPFEISPDIIFSDYPIPNLSEAKDCFSAISGLKGYTYRKDKPNGIPSPGNLYHWHVYLRGQECFAVNIDGTGHDGYHNVKLKSEVADFLRSMGVNIKASNIIETRIISSKQLLFD